MMMVCRTSSASTVVNVSRMASMSAAMRLPRSPTRRVSKKAIGWVIMPAKASSRRALSMRVVISPKSQMRIKLKADWRMSTAKMAAADALEVTSVDGQGQLEPGCVPAPGIHADAAQLAPQSGDQQGQHARKCDEDDAGSELEAVRFEIGGNARELPETVAVQLAFPRWGSEGIFGGGACVSGHGYVEIPLRRQS